MSNNFVVELIARYSRFAGHRVAVERAQAAARRARQTRRPPIAPAIHKVRDRVTPDVREEIVEAFRGGTSATVLAERYAMSRNSVLTLAANAGVPRQQVRMSEDEIRLATRLYGSGLSLIAVGAQLGREASTVHSALLRRGVATRDSHGRLRGPSRPSVKSTQDLELNPPTQDGRHEDTSSSRSSDEVAPIPRGQMRQKLR